MTDITYIDTDVGWLHLAPIIDLFSKKIVWWSMAEHKRTSLVSQALWMGAKQVRPASEPMAHSDRRVQSAGAAYRNLLDPFAMKATMGRRGNCYKKRSFSERTLDT